MPEPWELTEEELETLRPKVVLPGGVVLQAGLGLPGNEDVQWAIGPRDSATAAAQKAVWWLIGRVERVYGEGNQMGWYLREEARVADIKPWKSGG
ncbi:MAG: hypothetical protein ACE5JL_11190 [Dehalococcoidia bacterium]